MKDHLLYALQQYSTLRTFLTPDTIQTYFEEVWYKTKDEKLQVSPLAATAHFTCSQIVTFIFQNGKLSESEFYRKGTFWINQIGVDN